MYAVYDSTKGSNIDELTFDTYDEAYNHMIKYLNITEDEYNNGYASEYVWVVTNG